MTDAKAEASAPAQQDGGSTDPASRQAHAEEDRQWFAANPGRSYRLRPIHAAEMPEGQGLAAGKPGWRHFVVVRQVRPGHRIRLAFAATGEPAMDEQTAKRLFQLCLGSLTSRPTGARQASAAYAPIGILS